ncbi:MAG TPA: hypothetical protein OIL98_05900 [Lachnospiraceae bacterium]|nr:hypothetical protein [Lachnospiraceae bacterium]
MVAILILVVCVINTALLIRLNKCGKIVHVHEEHTYIAQLKKKKVVKKILEDEAD